MKKIFSLWSLFLLFTICCMTGCGKKEPDKLVICTDWSAYDEVRGAVSRWKTFGREGSTIQTEIIRIPADEVAAEIKISEIRTQIMAGEGPDLFIMELNEPYVYYDEDEIHTLFPNPEKAMYSDIFLPMDDYLKDAEFINIQGCNQVVLQAGQTEEGQLLFPIIYEYLACIFFDRKSQDVTPYPTSWEDVISNKSMGAALRSQTQKSLPQAFGKLADFENETILVKEEDVLKEVKRSYADKTWEDVKGIEVDGDFLRVLNEYKKNHTIYPIPNTDGGVTACISVYAGINRNTNVADEAFALLDTFYEITQVNEAFSNRGIFIAQDEILQTFYRRRWYKEEDITAFLEMNEKITVARFYSNWDTELGDIYQKHWDKGALTPEEAVSKLYNDMIMQVEE